MPKNNVYSSQKKKKTKSVEVKKKQTKPSVSGVETKKKDMLVAANWKMNPGEIALAKKLFLGVKEGMRKIKKTEVVVCPPFVYLDTLLDLYTGKKIGFGAQTCFSEKEGSYTGEVSAGMIQSLGARYVILGHSERRAMGETDKDVRERVQRVLEVGLTPIVCIGEHERDNDGKYLEVIKDQLQELFYGMSRDWMKNVIIAYEPIWAIGKSSNESVTPHALHETAIYIRKVLAGLFDKKSAISQTILYGGSVEPNNASELIDGTQVNGFLVGHASLESQDFLQIVEEVEKYAQR
ncbi:MAG: triose-phosphate isomerase [Candidatus Campbellbacteria bacterium]|nr:triose-phosphate isomerase [Candidatus Campbellbacteria bacterium]